MEQKHSPRLGESRERVWTCDGGGGHSSMMTSSPTHPHQKCHRVTERHDVALTGAQFRSSDPAPYSSPQSIPTAQLLSPPKHQAPFAHKCPPPPARRAPPPLLCRNLPDPTETLTSLEEQQQQQPPHFLASTQPCPPQAPPSHPMQQRLSLALPPDTQGSPAAMHEQQGHTAPPPAAAAAAAAGCHCCQLLLLLQHSGTPRVLDRRHLEGARA